MLRASRALLLAAALAGAGLPARARAQSAPPAPEVGTLSGSVTELAGGRGVGEVQLTVVGTSRGAVTSPDGTFRITKLRPGTYLLDARRVGYRATRTSVTVAAGEDAKSELRLASAAVPLDELVVTGQTGRLARREIGSAVVSIDAQALENAPVFTMSQLLQSRAPGVTVLPGGGKAGQGSRILMRGPTSLTQTVQPLVYVDGIRIDNSADRGLVFRGIDLLGGASWSGVDDINPADVDRIEIVRGASAASLYGTEAAAGVIQIFTKQGVAGQQRWNFRSELGTATTPREWWNVSAYDGIFHDQFVRTGRMHDQHLSVRGAMDRFSYYVGGSVRGESGVLPGDGADRATFRANLRVAPSQRVALNVSTGYTRRDVQLPYDGASRYGVARNGLGAGTAGIDAGTAGIAVGVRPADLDSVEVHLNASRFTGGVRVEHNAARFFSQQGTFGIDVLDTDNTNLARFGLKLGTDSTGQKINSRRQAVTANGEYRGTLRVQAARDLVASTSFGAQGYTSQLISSFARGANFAAPVNELVGGTTVASETRVQNRGWGVFADEQLAFRELLFLTVGARWDAHSAFGAGERQLYPKAQLSWVVSEHGFWPRGAGTLRLRGAYGTAGQQPSAFLSQRTYVPYTGNAAGGGFSTGLLGNPDLKPEYSRELEVGADAGLFGDRVAVEATVYRQRTANALYPVVPPPSTGFVVPQLENIGEVTNSGVELSARARLIAHRALRWSVHGSLFTNRSRVESIGGQRPLQVAGAQEIREGYAAGAFFADVHVMDGDSVALLRDQYIGPAFPTRSVQLGSEVAVGRGLSFGVLVDHRGGHYVESNTLRDLATFRVPANDASGLPAGSQVSVRCQAPADAAVQAACDAPLSARGDYIFKGDFWRLRELSAAYVLPTRWVRPLRVTGVTVNVAGRNLLRTQEYPGLEAEANYDATRQLSSQTYFDTPIPRQVVAGLSVQF